MHANAAIAEVPVTEPVPLELGQVAELARAGASPVAFSPYSDTPYLLLAVDEVLPSPERARVVEWLGRLVCPSIAIGDVDPDVAAACDVAVADPAGAAPVMDAVQANPVAATALVQTLRVIGMLPVASGLTVESMAYATLQAGDEYARWLAANRAEAPFRPADEGPAVDMQRDGETLALVLNRPSNHNAMSVEMRDALDEALGLVVADDSIRSVTIVGRGRCFSVGGDLTEFGRVPDAASGHIVRGLSVPGRLLADCADRAEARLHGACIGSGVEFPAFAGRVVAAANAHFQLPEVGMGLIPGAGGCVSIARRIGRQRTAWLALTGKRIRARRALEWGLVDAIDDTT